MQDVQVSAAMYACQIPCPAVLWGRRRPSSLRSSRIDTKCGMGPPKLRPENTGFELVMLLMGLRWEAIESSYAALGACATRNGR